MSFSSSSGSTSDLPDAFGSGNIKLLTEEFKQDLDEYLSNRAPTPPAMNFIILDFATGKPLTSSTGREICDPCTFQPSASGGPPVVDMPDIIDAAGGPQPPGKFIAIVDPTGVGGTQVSDQIANTKIPPPSPEDDAWNLIVFP